MSRLDGLVAAPQQILRLVATLVLTVIIASVPTHAHDISQDSRFESLSNPAHRCHHMRVLYWTEMLELAGSRIETLRYSHSPDIGGGKDGELAMQSMALSDQLSKVQRRYLDKLHEKAIKAGCYPWP